MFLVAVYIPKSIKPAKFVKRFSYLIPSAICLENVNHYCPSQYTMSHSMAAPQTRLAINVSEWPRYENIFPQVHTAFNMELILRMEEMENLYPYKSYICIYVTVNI